MTLKELQQTANIQLDQVSSSHFSTAEQAELARLIAPERRQTWIAGRLSLRILLQACLKEPVNQVEILTRNSKGQGVRPEVTVNGQPISGFCSLSHTEDLVAAAYSDDSHLCIGIDLTDPNNLQRSQLEWCLTPDEKNIVDAAANPPQTLATIWSFKEATYKACNFEGEGFNPQTVHVRQTEQGEWTATYRNKDLSQLGSFNTQTKQNSVLSLVEIDVSKFSI